MSIKRLDSTNYKNYLPSNQQFALFDHNLKEETELLRDWFVQKRFVENILKCGSELEFFLLDNKYALSPDNLSFVKKANKKYLIPEVGAAQLEINSGCFVFDENALENLENNLRQYWNDSFNTAREQGKYLIMIGHPPVANKNCYKKAYLTNKERYKIIDACMCHLEQGKKITIDIEGKDKLHLDADCLAMDGLTASFQLHLQIGSSESVAYYNAAQMIAAPVTAVSANSPFLFGHDLWAETRIGIFKEVMTLSTRDHPEGFKCCLFGTNYLTESFFEMFEQNYRFFPRLLPLKLPKNVPEKMRHVQIQNGVVYRWNRPVIDFSENNQPHLRIEQRTISSGPTIVDMMANAAFYYGLLNYYATEHPAINKELPFVTAKHNFHLSAKFGLAAKIRWLSGEETTIQALILNRLLREAEVGLTNLKVKKENIHYYLSIIKKRVKTSQNGSQWQRDWVAKYGMDSVSLTEAYLQNQIQGWPIHTWKI